MSIDILFADENAKPMKSNDFKGAEEAERGDRP